MVETTERLLGPSRWRILNRKKTYLDLAGDQLIISNRKETHHLSRSGLVAECKVVDGNVGGPIAREGTISGHAETRADNAVDPRRRQALLVTAGDGEIIEVEAAWGRTPKKIREVADRINQAP